MTPYPPKAFQEYLKDEILYHLGCLDEIFFMVWPQVYMMKRAELSDSPHGSLFPMLGCNVFRVHSVLPAVHSDPHKHDSFLIAITSLVGSEINNIEQYMRNIRTENNYLKRFSVFKNHQEFYQYASTKPYKSFVDVQNIDKFNFSSPHRLYKNTFLINENTSTGIR